MHLYFKNSRGEYVPVAHDVNSIDDAMPLISADVRKRNPRFEIFYYRIQHIDNGYWVDVGSWSEFYYLLNDPITIEESGGE